MTDIQYLDQSTLALKQNFHWHCQTLDADLQVVRWGNYGIPLLLFPTAGGDAEEVERFFLVKQLEPLIHEGRIKVYSVDSLNGRAWVTKHSIAHKVWMQKQFDHAIRHEVVPLIFRDCHSENGLPIICAGASIGALNALITVCRHPGIFRHAICLSGTFDIEKWLEGNWFEEFYYQSPLHFVPGLPEGEQLDSLRECFVLLATGQGENEDPEESWKVAHVLGQKQIPNRVDLWGHEWRHDWVTWREMIPKYVNEAIERIEG